MKKWPWILGGMVLTPVVAIFLWLGWLNALLGGPSLFLQLYSRDDGTIKWSQFYNLNVELEHVGKPLNLHVVISCGSVGRQIVGEGRSARSYSAPYIYGIEDQGHGVLVQTPGICGRDFKKYPIPEDYMPVLFWAPDAKNLEFMIAYLHEDAYAQPVSKLKFIKATIGEAERANYDVWRKTLWKRNIVPLADVAEEHSTGRSFFNPGDPPRHILFGEDDYRLSAYDGLACYSMVRLRLPQILRDNVQQFWPTDKPNYWLLKRDQILDLIETPAAAAAIRAEMKSANEESTVPYMRARRIGFENRSGIARSRSRKNLVGGDFDNHVAQFGLSHRIPYRSEFGYPWATTALRDTRKSTLSFDVAGGADQGFAYCYRNVATAYIGSPPTQHNGPKYPVTVEPFRQTILVDGREIGASEGATLYFAPHDAIIERDEFIWSSSITRLSKETARNQ
ncbi:MAG: hypothetical protein HOO99_07855 [Hyphomicrobiaceae bacterium]|nr:hypothetical protein [Hyphomicrobiaceae bacterium]